MRKQFTGVLLLLIASFIWGIAYIPTRYIGEQGFGIFFELAWRYSVPLILLGIIFFKDIKNSSKQNIYIGFTAGFILFIALVLSVYGIRTIKYGSMGLFLISLNTIFVPLYFLCAYKQKFNFNTILCIILAVLGSFLLTWDTASGINIGILLCFLASLGYTAYLIYCSYAITTDKISPQVIQFYQCLCFIILSIPLFFLLEFRNLPSINVWYNPSLWYALAFISIGAGTLGYQAFFYGQKLNSATTTAILLSMQTVFAAISEVLIFKISLTPIQIAAYAFIFLASILISIDPTNKSE